MKGRRYGLMAVVAAITVIAVLVTAASLPGYLREVGNLHTSFEYAQMYLDDEPYSELIIEYDYVAGHAPSPMAMELLEERVYQYTDKDMVTSIINDVIRYEDTREIYREEDVFLLSNDYKDNQRGGDTMVMHVLYLDGEWKEDNVLGLSYGGDRVVIFVETIFKVAQRSQDAQALEIESSVLVHEFGHHLALVGIGHESDHEDVEYPHHCDESAGKCVMASDIEVKRMGHSEAQPTDFCVLCQEEIDTVRAMEDELGLEEFLTMGVVGGEMIVCIGWIMVLVPKKEDRKKEFEIYKERYNSDFGKGRY